jgi:CubicO group peptidase (beta-lactamase class C family)
MRAKIVIGIFKSLNWGGYLNITHKIPATSQSMFRIASMTKSFIAMAILKLRDEKKLRLDDTVHLYIPEIRNFKLTQDSPDLTIRDLLIHSAGFPTDDPWADRSLHKTERDLFAFLKQGISFSNPPGIKYDYSNLAYTLLGVIIQKITVISFQEYIRKNIWQPLAMQQASWEFTDVSPNELALGYRWINNTWIEEEMLSDGIFGAMGGMITSIESFSQYVAFHQQAWPPRNETDMGLIKRSSIREMHRPWRFHNLAVSADKGEGALVSAYGYGLRWFQDSDKKIFLGHSGGLPGFGSHWLIMPDYGIGLILFTNVTYAVTGNLHLGLLNMLVKEASLKPRYISPSFALRNQQKALLQFLPDWKNTHENQIFSDNFFVDNPLDNLRKETIQQFKKMGKLIKIEELTAEDQLSGYFIMQGELTSLKISFSLSPHFPALIQKLSIK